MASSVSPHLSVAKGLRFYINVEKRNGLNRKNGSKLCSYIQAITVCSLAVKVVARKYKREQYIYI